jgi:hypothetical protein
MGIKFGEVDASQILENEFRIGVLERLLDGIIGNNPEISSPTKDDIDKIREKVANDLKKKYPNSGIEFKKN